MPQRRRADDSSSPRRRRSEWDGAFQIAAGVATFVFLVVATSRLGRDDASAASSPTAASCCFSISFAFCALYRALS